MGVVKNIWMRLLCKGLPLGLSKQRQHITWIFNIWKQTKLIVLSCFENKILILPHLPASCDNISFVGENFNFSHPSRLAMLAVTGEGAQVYSTPSPDSTVVRFNLTPKPLLHKSLFLKYCFRSQPLQSVPKWSHIFMSVIRVKLLMGSVSIPIPEKKNRNIFCGYYL